MIINEPQLSTNTKRALPRYRKVLAMRDAGVPVVDIARVMGVRRQMIYLILTNARKLREKGVL